MHRGKEDIAEQAQGTKVGVGSAKGPSSKFRTGAKSTLASKKTTRKLGSALTGKQRRKKTRPARPQGRR